MRDEAAVLAAAAGHDHVELPVIPAKPIAKFDQFALALQELKTKIAPTSGIRKLGQMLVWKHIKEDVQALLSQIERLKTLVGVALEVDHMSVYWGADLLAC